jgi:opacity protein-like surface antigen
MKFRSLILSLAALAPVSFTVAVAGESPVSSPAPAPLVSPAPLVAASGWFSGIQGSALWLEDMGYSTSTAFGTVGIDASFDVGWGVTIPFGYRFDNGFSLGASVGYYTAGLDTVSVSLSGDKLGELNLDADGTAVPILLNTSYSFQLSDTLSFSLGAGAGVAWSEFALDQIGGVDVDASVDGWDFSFQGFSSLNYSVNQTTELSLGYRYIQTETDADSIQGHNVEAGVIVRF